MKKMLLISSLLLLSGCGYLDSEPPAGKTEGYVHESTQQSEPVEKDEVESSEIVEETTESVEEEVEEVEEIKLGMAIFVPDREKMVSLPIVEEETPAYSQEDLAYWNSLASEYGLPAYDSVSDFYQFTARVQQAINNAQQSVVEQPVYQEPVYEEPVYEEPVYEEPVYEEPESSYEEPSSEVPSAPEESSLPDEASSYSQRTNHFNDNSSVTDESE